MLLIFWKTLWIYKVHTYLVFGATISFAIPSPKSSSSVVPSQSGTAQSNDFKRILRKNMSTFELTKPMPSLFQAKSVRVFVAGQVLKVTLFLNLESLCINSSGQKLFSEVRMYLLLMMKIFLLPLSTP